MNGNDTGAGSTRADLVRWVFNPFHYIAGPQALGLGIAILAVTAAICMASGSHLDGVLDFHTGAVAPWWVYWVEGPIDWLVLSVLLWAGGKLVSTSRVRAVDVFGTQALARYPYALLALVFLAPPVRAAMERVMVAMMLAATGGSASMFAGVSTFDVVVFFSAMALVFGMLVWMIALMYRGFAVSCNLSGVKGAVLFAVLLLCAEVLSKVGLIAVYTGAGM